MYVYHSIDEVPQTEDMNVTLTIGFFDGVHLDHRLVLDRLGSFFDPGEQITGLITFDRHPYEVVAPEKAPKQLTPISEKLEILKTFNLSYILFLPFTKELTTVPAQQFVEETLIDRLRVKLMIVGYDTRFGSKREGDAKFLNRMGKMWRFKVETIDPVRHAGKPVSSTAIRELLGKGDVKTAGAMLGRPYSVGGKVIRGLGIGNKLGVPTANIQPDPRKLIPADGVYAAKCATPHGSFKAAVSVGVRPTIPQKQPRRAIEAHLIGFSGELLDSDINLEFARQMRPQRKFDGVKSLVAQMKKDIELVDRYL